MKPIAAAAFYWMRSKVTASAPSDNGVIPPLYELHLNCSGVARGLLQRVPEELGVTIFFFPSGDPITTLLMDERE